MKNFKEMSFAECMRQSCVDLSEDLYPADIYACNFTLDAYVVRCVSVISDVPETWYHFYVRDVCSSVPVCFRAINSRKIADKLWDWYTRPC